MKNVHLGLVTGLLAVLLTANAKAGDCAGTPPNAVMALPDPLAKWAKIVCTPYGHVISSRDGWVWSNPGAYSPVFIPAQMVKKDPAPLGNKSYFTKIEMTKIEDDEFQEAYTAVHGNFAADSHLPDGYRLDVTSVSGDTLTLDFFDYGTYVWGIWCATGHCDPASRFMVLDMTHRPQ